VTPAVDGHSPDLGADGAAATGRPSRQVVVLGETRSAFHDSGVVVRRYVVTQLDELRSLHLITYDQYCAARVASALWRGAGLCPQVTSKYEDWVSGARGRWVATNDSEDEAAPWRDLVSSLPAGPGRALQDVVLGILRRDDLPRLCEALDRMSGDRSWIPQSDDW
jgi:hypothetical protein